MYANLGVTGLKLDSKKCCSETKCVQHEAVSLKKEVLVVAFLTFLQQGSDSWFVRHHQQVAHIGLFSLLVSA